MQRYASKPVTINTPIDELYNRLSDFSVYQERLNEMPEEIKARVGDVKFTADTIVITAAPVGEIPFEVVERTAPTRISLKAANSPVPVFLRLELTQISSDQTEVVSVIEAEIPMMLRPMVGGKLQEAADQFALLIGQFFNNQA